MSLRDSLHLLCCVTAVTVSLGRSSAADQPLHERIDQAIGFGNAEFDNVAAIEAGDAEFVRRVYLDLAGTIPSASQAREFVSDESLNKRAALVDQLLASPQFARRMQYVFDTTLMERRPDKHIKDEWREYLRQSFIENKSWDRLVTELLTSDGSVDAERPASKFLLDRELKTEATTRDLARLFLGRDLQCAQCHDHPNVDDYLQRHYHGLAAFLNRSYLFTDPKTKKVSIGEKAEGIVKFTSVFTSESDETAPRMLDLPAIQDPAPAKEPYKVKPDKKVRSVPVYSRRLKLAAAMTDPTNVAFRQNIANRLWAIMMGRGIVEPVDMFHSGNPPSHPELLEMLADDLHEHGYDIRYLLRELALTKTYQRSSLYRDDAKDVSDDRFAVALLKPLSPEQLAWSMMQATSLTDATLDEQSVKLLATKADGVSEKVADPIWQEETLHTALKPHVDTFVGFFGVSGVQTSQFDASANQALFLRNGELLQKWLAQDDNRLTQRLATLESRQLIDELYFSVLSRPPTDDEIQQLTTFVDSEPKNRITAIQQLVWAALSSAEFRFNH